MNSIYKLLQRFAFELCILFGTAPYSPSFIQKNFGGAASAIYSWSIFATSLLVFLLCALWMKYELIVVKKPAYMMALTFGSVLGIMIGASALLGLYGFGTRFYLLWRDVPALVLGIFMLGGVTVQLLMPKHHDDDIAV